MLLTTKIKVENEKSVRHYDDNGFLFVEESPILSTDVLQYLGKELLGDNQEREIDGILVKPDEIYTVRIPDEELEKAKHTFELLPILDGHEWVGNDGKDSKGLQEGSTGQNAEVKGNKLFLSLKFTGKKIIDKIKNGIEELSASYQHNLSRDAEKIADFIATSLEGNHLAVVPKGRCGSGVCVFNNDGVEMEKSKKEMILLIDGKRIDLSQFFEEESKEEEHKDTSIQPAENNADEVEEKKEEIKEEKLEEKPAENSCEEKNEEMTENADEEKADEEKSENTLADDVKGLLADKIAPEKLEKILALLEEKAEVENECDDEKKEEIKAENSIEEIMQASKRAYNEAVAIVGDNFNAVGMNAQEIYSYALNQRGVKTENRSCAELQAMVESLKSVKVDNAFNPDTMESSEFIEINL